MQNSLEQDGCSYQRYPWRAGEMAQGTGVLAVQVGGPEFQSSVSKQNARSDFVCDPRRSLTLAGCHSSSRFNERLCFKGVG